MDFFTNTNNLLLLATLITSGLALALPQIMGRLNKQLLSVTESVQFINQHQAQILDIRTAEEFKAGHIPNSKHLPLSELDSGLKQAKIDSNKPIILVCLSGNKANTALAKLKKAGCKDVVCMEGGISAWNQAGMPLIKKA
jgi:rhodanese-related sulfurtransferase